MGDMRSWMANVPPFFNTRQALQQEGLLILAGDVMVDIIADHRIKSSVRKGQGVGVSRAEKSVVHALGHGVPEAQGLGIVGVFLAQAVYAGEMGIGIPLGAGDGQSAAAAAHVQALSVIGKVYIT